MAKQQAFVVRAHGTFDTTEDLVFASRCARRCAWPIPGYRQSLEKALDIKRNANAVVDAISAEDIDKFPETNAAESLSHLPDISVDRQFGEGEKVSINGTDPALNRVLIGTDVPGTSVDGGARRCDKRTLQALAVARAPSGIAVDGTSPKDMGARTLGRLGALRRSIRVAHGGRAHVPPNTETTFL